MTDVNVLYPADNLPYRVVLDYKEFSSGSWGWEMRLVDGEDSRDIRNRGAVNLDGSPATRPFNFSEGYWQAGHDEGWSEPQTVTLQLRMGGTDEGRWTLTPETAPEVKLFWEHTAVSAQQANAGPFAVDTDGDGSNDMTFILDYAASQVEIYINGDPDPEFYVAFNRVNSSNVPNQILRRAIRAKLKDLGL